MKAKCYKCQWDWNYKGKSTKHLTCPKCLYKLNVEKALGKLPTYLPNSNVENPYKKTIKEPEKEFVGNMNPTSSP